MRYLSDFHTHTAYCDGKDTPEQMIKTAISLGFSAYGFSGHSVSPFGNTGAMTPESEAAYISEITALKEKYSDRLEIYLGIEQELLSEHTTAPYEYVIGSVHVLNTRLGPRPLDLKPENITSILDECYEGDFEALAEDYFREVASIPERMRASVIGHIDLLAKFSDTLPLTMGKRYFDAAFAAVDRLIPYGIPFEINVGAISRGYRTTPYPDPRILKHIRSRGGEIMINGDTHSAAALGKHLETARSLAEACGYTHALVIKGAGYEKIPL